MDEKYLLTAASYIELNPVRAGLSHTPEDYPWSSCKAHLQGEDDILVKVRPLLNLVPDWKNFLATSLPDGDRKMLRQHERTGRPLGDDNFINKLETLTSRILRKRKPGPKKKHMDNAA